MERMTRNKLLRRRTAALAGLMVGYCPSMVYGSEDNMSAASRDDSDFSSMTNVPLMKQDSNPTFEPASSRFFELSSTQPQDIVTQNFRQELQMSKMQQFTEMDIVDYQFLMASYTANLGLDEEASMLLDHPSLDIMSTCKITDQNLVTIFGQNDTQTNLLTLSFTMEYNNGGLNALEVDNNYPAAFASYVNNNLELVTLDLKRRSIPVAHARVVEAVEMLSAPTDAPSVKPTAFPTSAAPTTKEPTSLPTKSPSFQPTNEPTPKPTEAPSLRPTSNPTVDPTRSPTSSPSGTPTTTKKVLANTQTYTVLSKMVLHTGKAMLKNDNGELLEEAKETWVQVTQDWIHDATMKVIYENNDNAGINEDDVTISVSLNSHEVLDQIRKMKRTMASTKSSGKSLRRHLMSGSPLQLDFTTDIEIITRSDDDADDGTTTVEWEANEMVASGFQSADQQEAYLASLKDANENFNDGSLESMTMEVDGQSLGVSTPEAEKTPSTKLAASNTEDGSTGNNNNDDDKQHTWIYAIAVAFGAIIMLLLMGLYYGRKIRGKRGNVDGKSSKSSTRERPLSESDELNESRLEAIAYFDDDDDSDEEGVSHTSSSYDEDDDDDEELCHYNTNEGNNNDTPTTGDGAPAVFNSISVTAPPGKLGIVIANPQNDVPMVLQMKKGSVLQGQVTVGDLLLSVDEVDCSGMSAAEVSELIGQRSGEESRRLVLLREQ